MRMIGVVACLAALLGLAVPNGFATTPPAPKSGHGLIVIVFKDGHRQSFNLSDIERVEFPAPPIAAEARESAPVNPSLPSRARFLGKWEAGVGDGGKFFITLEENGDAKKSLGGTHGKWVYVNGEAHIAWDDGWQDAIRKVGSKYQKFAYRSGKSFTDIPDNVTNARKTTPQPI